MNTIYIHSDYSLDGKNNFVEKPKTFVVPILEDFTIEAQSEFASFGDLVPAIADLTGMLTTASTIDGSLGRGTANINNMLSAQRWQRTNPVKISVTLHFYTKTDPAEEVIRPVNTLLGLHLPLKLGDKNIRLPGINANNMKAVVESLDKNTGKVDASKGGQDISMLVAVFIPGVVYIPNAFVYDAKPTYSRQITESGYPLWATLECQFWGASMALTENFTLAMNITSKYNNSGYLDDTGQLNLSATAGATDTTR